MDATYARLLNAQMSDERRAKEREQAARHQAQRRDEAIAARNAAIAEQQRIAAERDQERRAEARAQLEAELRTRYLRAGGRPEEWERDKARIVQGHLESCALTGGGSLRDDVGELRSQSAYNRI